MTASPPDVIHARHGLAELAARLADLGARRVLILAAPSRRFVDRVVDALRTFQPVVFDGARAHVPAEVVAQAAQALAQAEADTLVSVGGGSTIGLGKALRLAHQVHFAVIPTTYSGSEMTSVYGVTRGAEKTTGRDPRVRPDIVLYDAALGATQPIGLSIQSLMNALAHLVSVLSTSSLHGDDRTRALATAAALVGAMEDLLLAPTDLGARDTAQRAASAAGVAFDRGRSGAQHALAHLLGGGLGLAHAALHSVLLPQFVAHVRDRDPALVDELELAIGRRDLEPRLHDLLARAGVPTSLEALGVDPAAVGPLLATRPELPASVVADAQFGLRPTGRAGRIELGAGPAALLAGPRPERARRVVLALHGRGAEAGGIVRRFSEIAGHDPDTAIVGLRNASNRWYAIRASEPGAGSNAEVARALAQVDAALSGLGRPAILAGFSQGACLALEYAARRPGGLTAVVAAAGSRIGTPAEWAPAAPGTLAGLPVLVGGALKDPLINRAHLDATVAWLRAAGADVDVIDSPGERHDISTRQRLRAREIIRGERAPAGPMGFGNALSAEALAGALPPRQNSPRLPPHGLYAEQVNGSAFTSPRWQNARTWLYRVRPSSQRRAFAPLAHARFAAAFEGRPAEANLAGFAPLPLPDAEHRDFVDGMVTLGGAGSAPLRRGYAVHRYAADRDMERRAFYDADGDLLILPEVGALTALTELGPLDVAPGQIALLPRGIAFSIFLHGRVARGYVAETYGRGFHLPERGPIGANGLADPRHFRAPPAWYEDKLAPDFRIVAKLGGRLHEASQDHSPFDVVAWHGNHVPFVYDLDDFSPVGAVRFDHADPSVFTVLTAPMDEPGANTLDLIVFPPRWDVTEGTFRPPFFHRNATTEVNGIVREAAPPDSPFQPGCCYITPSFTAHGVSGRAVARIRAQADAEADRPARMGTGLWFQLECALPFALTPWAEDERLPDWPATWGSHPSYFET